jgi:O-antigen/teichoic acid export membrane protein
VLISNLGDKIVFATDSIVIGLFLPISALTYFAIGGNLIEMLRSFITSMASIFNPLSSSLEARKESRAVALVLSSGTRAAMLIGLPACIGFLTLGERFIRLWMGPEYSGPAGEVLRILTVGHLIGLPYYTISGVLYGLGRHQVIAYSRIFEGVLNLVLSIVLIRSFGLAGVAIGTAIPQAIVVAGVLPVVMRRWVDIDLRDYYTTTYLRPFLASLPFWAACWAVEHFVQPADMASFFVTGAATLITYVVPCWFAAFTAQERAVLSASLRLRIPGRRPVEGLS